MDNYIVTYPNGSTQVFNDAYIERNDEYGLNIIYVLVEDKPKAVAYYPFAYIIEKIKKDETN